MKFLRKLLGLEDDKIIGLCAFKFAKSHQYTFPRFDNGANFYSTNGKNNFLLL